MESAPLPFETIVYVCTHQRAAGERVACANPGRAGQQIRDDLKRRVKELGWEGKIRVCASSCLDQCEKGPNAVVVGPAHSTWYSHIQQDQLEKILFKN